MPTQEPPTADSRPNGTAWDMKLGWGTKTLSVRGLGSLFVLAVFAVVASNLYAGWQIQQAMSVHTDVTRTE
ncbi:MAG: hypothetical protein ACREXT_08225, partial [Gammaproteobacteria bacterium]